MIEVTQGNRKVATKRYRKTATIEAVQWFKMGDHPAVVLKAGGTPWINTLEGGHIVTPGDWIATGIKGEHWPIKPYVFAATYKLVTDNDDAYNLVPETSTAAEIARLQQEVETWKKIATKLGYREPHPNGCPQCTAGPEVRKMFSCGHRACPYSDDLTPVKPE